MGASPPPGAGVDFTHSPAESGGTERRAADRIVTDLRALFETLSTREREVLALVSSGLMNKQIAAELGLAEITVKIHRGHIMKKMGARSLADLLRKAETLGVRRNKP